MIGDTMFQIFADLISKLPVISLPAGASHALDFLMTVIGYVNYFVPMEAAIPIITMIIVIRNLNILLAIINWIIRLIPFIG